jgi:uncharacterized membrane protein
MIDRVDPAGLESDKERTDRQLAELLAELRVVLPGAQVLLAFLFAVPFATRFGQVDHVEQAALFISLLATVAATVCLMTPSVYHRVRWQHGGKGDVILMAHRFFLVGSALLAVGLGAAVFCVADFLYGNVAAYLCAGGLTVLVLLGWCGLPLLRERDALIREGE